MKASIDALTIIMGFEAFKEKPYRCPGGVLTIGYGTTNGVTKDMKVTHQQAVDLMKKDISKIEYFLNSEILIPLKQNQFDALISFVYNIGISQFKTSTILKLLNKGNIGLASQEFTKWSFIKKVWWRGLYRRRLAEKALFDL